MISDVRVNEMVPIFVMSDQPIDDNSRPSERTSTLASFLSCLTAPIFCCIGSIEVRPNYETIVTRWGIPKEVLKVPGYHPFNKCGLETHEMFMKNLTGRIEKLAVNDLHGNPIQISAQYTYCIKDSLKAHYAMDSLAPFVKQQAKTTLLKVASCYPYDSKDDIPRLCVHSKQIDQDLRNTLNSLIEDVGLRILAFKIISIAVDDDMQRLLLAKQQAQAYITGRKKTAESAFQIAKETVEAFSAQNIALTDQQKNALISDILYMICDHKSSKLDFYRIKDE
jgi:regulator of protease activity HflC (stomatin/prohibitin superfamily)